MTGQLTNSNVPYAINVIPTSTGTPESTRARQGTRVGPSTLHAGFVEWDVTGPNPDGNLYHVSLPPVLPGNGGYFDADLQIDFAGGANGSWQIPMFDCTVSGGPARLSTPPGPRSFTCSGSLGEPFTFRSVSGRLTRSNAPYQVTVTEQNGTVDTRRFLPVATGPSPLHGGYTEWNVTGPNPNGDLFHLSLPPVLPPAGGYFDADLQIDFAGGANGNLQIPMFDCTVR